MGKYCVFRLMEPAGRYVSVQPIELEEKECEGVFNENPK